MTLKGHAPPTVSLDLDYISSHVYGLFITRSYFKVEPGSRVLLFMKKRPGKELQAADEQIPFLPLAADIKPAPIANISVFDHVIRLMLNSMQDPVLRRVETHFLHSVVNKQLHIGLKPYISDPDPATQNNVLDCLRVVQQEFWWAEELRGGHLPVGDIVPPLPTGDTSVKKLNGLLFDAHAAVRRRALALLNIRADKTSIPYLILTVRGPDTGNAYAAYAIARRLTGTRQKYATKAVFQAHHSEASDRLRHWWVVDNAEKVQQMWRHKPVSGK